MKEINRHFDQIRLACVNNKVKSLFAFGSVTTEKFHPDSDIDLIVDIDENDPLIVQAIEEIHLFLPPCS